MEATKEKVTGKPEAKAVKKVKRESKMAKYWRTEYTEGVILDMRAVLK